MDYDEVLNIAHGKLDFAYPLVVFIQLDDSLDNDYNFECCMRLLSLTTQQKILDKKLPRDRQLKLLDQLILPIVLSIYNKDKQLSIPKFRYTKFGKPYLDKVPFNISDEDGVVSIVVDFSHPGNELGCDLANLHDVQRFNSDGKFVESFKDIFTHDESVYLQQFDNLDEQNLLLTEYWALKESYSKLLGTGLNESFQNFNFSDNVKQGLIPTTKVAVLDTLVTVYDTHWESYPLSDKTNYITMINDHIVCSIFSTDPVPRPQLVELSLPQLISLIKSSSQ